MAKKTVSNELKGKIKDCLYNLPISLNTHYGDPFQDDQFENTLEKLRYLKAQNYRGEIEVSTKWIITDEQIETLYAIAPDMWIICGVTGLNEMKGVTLEDRFDNYLRICKRFRKTIINLRPLIPGLNDNMETLKPIIETAAKGRKLLKHGGYLDPRSFDNKKTTYDELKKKIHAYCEALGVNDGPRCTCIVTDVTGRICSTYAELAPTNLDVLEALGYRYETENGYIKLLGYEDGDTVTKGDVAFVRHIIQSSHILPNYTDRRAIMSMKGPEGQVLVCTSSWFHWAREVDCIVNCFYCHVKPDNAIIQHFEAGDTGCSPVDLYEFLFEL